MLKRLITATILALLATAVQAAGLFPMSRQQVLDSNSKVMPGARLFLFDGGTTTPRIAYRDLALTTPHPNPIVADSAGRLPLIYLDDGYYRQRLTTKTGTLIFDDDGIPVLTTSAGGSGTSVDPDSVFKTGDYKLSHTDQPVAGYVRANGRTIGSAASGATERANADTQPLYEHLWAFANTSVTGGKGANAAADYAANKPLVLPDFAGRAPAGSDDLGAGARGVLTSSFCVNPAIPGSPCGAQSATLLANNLPVSAPWLATATVNVVGSTDAQGSHSHNVSGSTSSDGNHQHNVGSNTQFANVTVGSSFAALSNIAGVTTIGVTDAQGAHSHSVTGTTDAQGLHAHNVIASGTPVVTMQNNAGGGQAVNKLSPILTVMILLRL